MPHPSVRLHHHPLSGHVHRVELFLWLLGVPFEGGVSLEPYPALRAWLARIEALPRFVGMVRNATHAATACGGR